jgi:hypothetical protein
MPAKQFEPPHVGSYKGGSFLATTEAAFANHIGRHWQVSAGADLIGNEHLYLN